MNINDNSALETLNKLILVNRLTTSQILKIVKLAPVSNNIQELKDNFKWEEP